MPKNRFNWPAFRAFLHTVLDQHIHHSNEHEYVAISLPVPMQTNNDLAKRLVTSKPTFYLSHPTNSFTIVGQGAL